MRLALSLAVTLVANAAGASALSRGAEDMAIHRVPGKMGAVRFTHGAHSGRYRRPDGGPIRCKDCHHNLAGDVPASDEERARMTCAACHPGVEEPARVVDGKRAPPFGTLKPDGALDHRSILFHASCWACHRQLRKDGVPLTRCKHCHDPGVTGEILHGRYDR